MAKSFEWLDSGLDRCPGKRWYFLCSSAENDQAAQKLRPLRNLIDLQWKQGILNFLMELFWAYSLSSIFLNTVVPDSTMGHTCSICSYVKLPIAFDFKPVERNQIFRIVSNLLFEITNYIRHDWWMRPHMFLQLYFLFLYWNLFSVLELFQNIDDSRTVDAFVE